VSRCLPLLLDKTPGVRRMAARALATLSAIDAIFVQSCLQHAPAQEVLAYERAMATPGLAEEASQAQLAPLSEGPSAASSGSGPGAGLTPHGGPTAAAPPAGAGAAAAAAAAGAGHAGASYQGPGWPRPGAAGALAAGSHQYAAAAAFPGPPAAPAYLGAPTASATAQLLAASAPLHSAPASIAPRALGGADDGRATAAAASSSCSSAAGISGRQEVQLSRSSGPAASVGPKLHYDVSLGGWGRGWAGPRLSITGVGFQGKRPPGVGGPLQR
jgi:hypothetical protein